MVFRPNPEKFKKLKHECNDFLKLVANLVDWMKNVKSLKAELFIDQLRNWQVVLTGDQLFSVNYCILSALYAKKSVFFSSSIFLVIFRGQLRASLIDYQMNTQHILM